MGDRVGQSSPGAVPAAAWRRALGLPMEHLPEARLDQNPLIDDGPWGGVPIGGIGSGSIGRTHGGDFARWHVRVGSHRFAPSDLCQFWLFVEHPDGRREGHVLSTLRPDETHGWTWDYPVGAGEYAALFPRAWLTYDWDALPVRLVQTQLSPVIAGNERETSYPVGVFDWSIENRTAEPLRVELVFSWPGLTEDGELSGDAAAHVRPSGITLANRSGGEFAIEASGAGVSATAIELARATELWAAMESTGAFPPAHTPNPGELLGAVAVSLDVAPDQPASARFALAWDFPTMTFGHGTTWYRRYTRFWGRVGGRAADIAAEGLRRFDEWNAAIDDWQRPTLDDPSRPDWYAGALFNELYVLVDGGSAWEDGRLGEPQPADGDGRFCFLECHDYRYYNTHDVLFYASSALLLLWPGLERQSLRQLLEAMPVQDDEPVVIEATGEPGIRKEAWMAPHDVGGPEEDPWLVLNTYHFQDPNRWKDLNAYVGLWALRDARALNDRSLVEQAWPGVQHALAKLEATDVDGDGLPDHDGRADQTFDTWPMNGPSAFAGGLWLATLGAAIEMAEDMGDSAAANRYQALRVRGQDSYLSRLWNGRYLLYDGSGGPHSDSVMAGQLTGTWALDDIGLTAYLPDDVVAKILDTILEKNVRGFALGQMGAVNGVRPDGSVDLSSDQSQEVWPGICYSLAALLLLRGRDADAWDVARGAVRVTYERGLWFRTPEAWDEKGNFRASLYMRPLAIWAMESALRKRAAG